MSTYKYGFMIKTTMWDAKKIVDWIKKNGHIRGLITDKGEMILFESPKHEIFFLGDIEEQLEVKSVHNFIFLKDGDIMSDKVKFPNRPIDTVFSDEHTRILKRMAKLLGNLEPVVIFYSNYL